MKRREFIHYSSLVAGGLMIPSTFTQCTTKPSESSTEQGEKLIATKPVGIQLYTLKDVIFNDLQGTLKKVADIGYKEVETFSYGDGKIFGVPFSDFVKMCNDLGLTIRSGHYSTQLMNNSWEQAITDAASANQKYMVLAYLQAEERTSIDDYKNVTELLNKCGESCKKAGIQMGYHNHEFEFVTLEDQIPYDVMLQELDRNLVTMELDLYWITRAGFNPLNYFEKYSGRFELWHVKDMDKVDPTHNADVGTGSIDFKTIFNQADQSGMKHFFLEQEYFTGSQFDSIKAGYDHLGKLLS